MRVRSSRLDGQLWRIAIVTFVVGCLLWPVVAYAAAWATPPHHAMPDSVGFTDGHLSVPGILLMAAGSTAGITLAELGRRWRRARPTAR